MNAVLVAARCVFGFYANLAVLALDALRPPEPITGYVDTWTDGT